MNQEKKVVKISDVVQNQIPEFILSENPNFVEFLKQYYISQEVQGSTVDIAENLISYKNLDSFDTTNLISETTLTSEVDFFDDSINVSSTAGWPQEYGLLKIDNEIITYTGITSTTFTGCIRGFSGISSLSQENNPEFLVFSQTETDSHTSESTVINLSNLFLKEFFKKIKYQFTPGFEELEFDLKINPQNFISKAKTFYQTKGTDEAFKILFKVLYAEDVKIIKPDDFCFTPSDDKWRVVETFVCNLVSGNPFDVREQTLYQDKFPEYNIESANGSIYNVEAFTSNEEKFYKIQLFSGYSNNLNPKGSINGTFATTPKTYVIENIGVGSKTITVDSTVGFENTGILEIDELSISYTDKTNNQFLNCSGVTSNILKKSKVFSNHYIYAYEKTNGNLVKFKLNNVLSGLTSSTAIYSYDGDPIQIDHLGSTEESKLLQSLVYNHPITVSCGEAVRTITTQIRNNQKQAFSISNGSALCEYPHYLKTGDIVDMYIANTDQLIAINLSVNVFNSKEFSIPITSVLQSVSQLSQSLDFLLGKIILFKRTLKKSPYQNLNLSANVQDSYLDSNFYYLTSNGLPEYEVNPLLNNGSFTTPPPPLNAAPDTYLLISSPLRNHQFKNGDEVVVSNYSTSPGFNNNIGINTGNYYFIRKDSNNTIKLCESKENVGLSSFIPLIEYNILGDETGRLSSVNLVPSSEYNRAIGSSKLFKKFPKTISPSQSKINTFPGNVGVFVNGVELRNYKSFDKIYYGPVDSITVLNPGNYYNILNPPQFKVVYDESESLYTKIIPQLKGKLINLLVTDPGFDYIETPTVKILGGNNFSVVADVKMKNVINQVDFNATTKDTVIDTVNNKFNFTSKHRFETGEPVIYKTNASIPIGIGTNVSDGNLINDSVYYAVSIGAGTSMSLAFNRSDALSKTNLIKLRTYGGGLQSFVADIPRKAIDEVTVIQNEKDFEYKKVSFVYSDVDDQDNIITIKNHGFSTDDEVVYSWNPIPGYNGGSIGLSTTNYYYITKIDDDQFRLSETKNSTNYFNFSQAEPYSIYFLEYSPVRVEIFGSLTISGVSSTVGYEASILPTISGSVTSALVEKRPNSLSVPMDSFGEKNIINYENSPTIRVIEGEGAVLQPLIVDGKIKQVIVKNFGSGYFNSLDLVVVGDGFGAKLTPVISNGSFVSVKVVNGGVNYSENNTKININPIGTGLKLKANLKSWTINDVERYELINIEDGKIFGKNYSLDKNTFGVYFLNSKLKTFLNIPSTPTSHSPIVGWSYDGCPIYGPYGYTNSNGTGGISRMKSGYSYISVINSEFKLVEEYVFEGSGTLDKYNGRFCITPEYPQGIYAYFCTFDDNNSPKFPYTIGPQYNCEPVEDNFNLKINQSLNFNNLNIVKWTSPYRVEDSNSKYEYFQLSKNANDKDILIEQSSTGFIDKIKIVDGGFDYQVNDSILFDDEGTSGFGALAKVSEVSGVGISSIQSQSSNFSGVSFTSDGKSLVGIASTYHSFKNNSYINISGISTTSFKPIEGFRKITISDITTKLISNLGPSTITGIVTSIQVAGSIYSFDIDSQWSIDGEIVKIIGLDYKNNLINILRPSNSTSHLALDPVYLLPNKFTFVAQDFTPSYSEKNESYYFDSTQSVSIGTTIGVGYGNTLSIYPLGLGNSYTKYVPPGGIYLPNNKFNTGDEIIYTPGTSTIITNYGNLNTFSNLFALKLDSDIIGIVTSRSNLSNQNTILTYTSTGTGNLHNFTTNKNIITGNITKNNCLVSTASTHNLSVGDVIKLNVKSGVAVTFTVTYSNNRVLINSQTNPKIDVYANDVVTFDLSNLPLNKNTFDLYEDKNFLNPYSGNLKSNEIIKTSTSLILNINNNTPRNLFYNLSDSNIDIDVDNYNQLKISESKYNTKTSVVSSTDYTFTVNLDDTPERSLYKSDLSSLSYSVLSEGVLGPISNVEITSKGSRYKKLPKIKSVISNYGTGCNLFADSETIGKIEKVKVINTKYVCPSDKTLRPESKVFSALKLIENYTVDSLNVINGGQNYIFEPQIKLYNSRDKRIIVDFSASATLKNNSIENVQILNPGNGLKSSDSKVIVTDNTNGFNIINVSVTGSSAPYTVTLTLKTPPAGFTTSNPLPVEVGDEIFVEGIVFNGNGFNSSDYGYQPFTVSFVNPAFGSQDSAIIRYELNVNPGSYDSQDTYEAYVTPFSYIPKIEAVFKQNSFHNNETVNTAKITNNVNNNPLTNLIKVKDPKNISANDVIIGKSSNSKGTVNEITNFNSTFTSDYSVSEILGGTENRSFLSSNFQKLSDNDYYQKFAYSLKSKKSYSEWESPVSDTSHILGYKKFSDLSVESIATESVILPMEESTLNIILDSYGNVNRISDYDLVNEIDLEDNNGEHTQYLRFLRLKLGQSLKFTNNRVLSIDDISNLFNNQPTIPSIVLDRSFPTVLKYQFYLTGTDSFFGQFVTPEIFELFVTRDKDIINLTSYSNYFEFGKLNPFLGVFTAEINSTNNSEIVLNFTPTNPFITVDIKAVKEMAPNTVGIATTSFGYVKNVETCEQYAAGIGSTVFYSISSLDCNSGSLIVGISSVTNSIQKSFECSFVNTQSDLLVSAYSENTLNNLGEVNIYKNGSNIEFVYTEVVGVAVTLSANLKLLTNTYAGNDSIIKTFTKFSSSQITTNSNSTGISTVSATYGYTKYILDITQTIGVSTQRSLVQINSLHNQDYLNNIIYDMNGTVDLNDLNFESYYSIANNNYTLFFNPITSANYKITIYESSILAPNQ